MGNIFSEEVGKTDPRWFLSQESSKRISHQLAKTIQTVHTHYKRELNGDKEKAYCCLLRDFDRLLIETEPSLKGNRLFETRKIMLYRNLSKERDIADLKEFIVKATMDKITAAAEIQLDIDFSKIIALWFENDEDMSGTLDLGEMAGLVKKLGLELSDDDLRKRMISYQRDSNARGSNVKLDFNGFFSMYLDMTTVKAVADIFKSNKTTPTDLMDVTDLVRFLKATQKIRFERTDAYRVVEALFRDVKRDKGFEGVTYRQFQSYLLDYQVNGWFEASYRYVWQDMSQPLTHYFIHSSHNTYCQSGQISGEADPSMYSKVLRDGCRCVEIDCWPGGGDARGPRVTHGGTLMTHCWFRDVCIAINEAAFEVSVYPVILSLELHVEDSEQTIMVEIMREIFGSQLLSAKEIEAMEFGGKEFTPLGLIRKILVKCKKETADNSDSSDDDTNYKTGTSLTAAADGTSSSPAGGGKKGAAAAAAKDAAMLTAAQQHLHVKKAAANNRLAAVSTVQAKAIPKSVRGNIRQSLSLLRSFKHFNIVSISEQTFPKWHKFLTSVAATTQNTLIRTYPKGTRIDSSNYSATEGWALGAQCVALNLQTRDMHYYINRALFKTNGDSGYVLKPKWMLEDPKTGLISDDGTITIVDEQLIEKQQQLQSQQGRGGRGVVAVAGINQAESELLGSLNLNKLLPLVEMKPEPLILKIVVVCAQNIPIPANADSVSPIITLQVISSGAMESMLAGGRLSTATLGKETIQKGKTEPVKNNGFDPHWLQTFTFSVNSLSMSYLYITVSTKVSSFGSSEVLLGENAINLAALRSGYRAVPFFNSQKDVRTRKTPVLLCHFELQKQRDIDKNDI